MRAFIFVTAPDVIAQGGACEQNLFNWYSYVTETLHLTPVIAVWDVAATSLIVEEAGGRFSDLRGKHDIRAGNAVITNGQLHAETIATIQALRS